MNKVWLKEVSIYNLSDCNKGSIKLKPKFNIILSNTNDQGKTLIADSLFYALGNSFNPFKSLQPREGENINEVLIKALYVIGDDEYTFYRSASKINESASKKIAIFKNDALFKIYYSNNRNGHSFADLYKDIYKILSIPNIIAINKVSGANNKIKVSMPYLPSVLGFFVIKQNNKNNEFKSFDEYPVAMSNKWKVDGRLLTFIYLSGVISDDEAAHITIPADNEKVKKQLLDDKKETSKIIDRLNLNSQFKSQVTSPEINKLIIQYNDDRRKLDEIASSLVEVEQEKLRIKNALKYLRSQTTKINKFVEKISDEKFPYFDVETGKSFNIPARVLFNKLSESDVDNSYDDLLDEQNVIETKYQDIKKKYDVADDKLTEDYEKMNVLKANKNLSLGNDASILILDDTVNEFKKELKETESKIAEMNVQIKNQTEEQTKILSSLKGKEQVLIKKVKELIETIDAINPLTNILETKHIDIESFPVGMTSERRNTGSSILSYALTKLLFYIKELTRIDVPILIEYEGTDEADKQLIEYNKKALDLIIEACEELDKQLIVFKNATSKHGYYNSSFIDMTDKKKYEYNLVNVDPKLTRKTHNFISEKMDEDEIKRYVGIFNKLNH